jgi:hypothetical protein
MQDRTQLNHITKQMTAPEAKMKVDLIQADREALSMEFERTLGEIFARFDKNGDTTWDDEEMDEFIKFIYGVPFGRDTKEEIRTCLNCDKDGKLTYLGLCEFYKEQTIENEEATWEDLHKLGFDCHLKWHCKESRRKGKKPLCNQCSKYNTNLGGRLETMKPINNTVEMMTNYSFSDVGEESMVAAGSISDAEKESYQHRVDTSSFTDL